MINRAPNPSSAPSPVVDAEWVAVTAEKVLEAVEERRWAPLACMNRKV
jgi:hypothetical protein